MKKYNIQKIIPGIDQSNTEARKQINIKETELQKIETEIVSKIEAEKVKEELKLQNLNLDKDAILKDKEDYEEKLKQISENQITMLSANVDEKYKTGYTDKINSFIENCTDKAKAEMERLNFEDTVNSRIKAIYEQKKLALLGDINRESNKLPNDRASDVIQTGIRMNPDIYSIMRNNIVVMRNTDNYPILITKFESLPVSYRDPSYLNSDIGAFLAKVQLRGSDLAIDLEIFSTLLSDGKYGCAIYSEGSVNKKDDLEIRIYKEKNSNFIYVVAENMVEQKLRSSLLLDVNVSIILGDNIEMNTSYSTEMSNLENFNLIGEALFTEKDGYEYGPKNKLYSDRKYTESLMNDKVLSESDILGDTNIVRINTVEKDVEGFAVKDFKLDKREQLKNAKLDEQIQFIHSDKKFYLRNFIENKPNLDYLDKENKILYMGTNEGLIIYKNDGTVSKCLPFFEDQKILKVLYHEKKNIFYVLTEEGLFYSSEKDSDNLFTNFKQYKIPNIKCEYRKDQIMNIDDTYLNQMPGNENNVFEVQTYEFDENDMIIEDFAPLAADYEFDTKRPSQVIDYTKPALISETPINVKQYMEGRSGNDFVRYVLEDNKIYKYLNFEEKELVEFRSENNGEIEPQCFFEGQIGEDYIRGIIFNKSIFITKDLIDWEEQNFPLTAYGKDWKECQYVDFGGEIGPKFIALTETTIDNHKLLISSDARTWYTKELPNNVDGKWRFMSHGFIGGDLNKVVMVIVSYEGTGDRVLISENGDDYVVKDLKWSGKFFGVSYFNSGNDELEDFEEITQPNYEGEGEAPKYKFINKGFIIYGENHNGETGIFYSVDLNNWNKAEINSDFITDEYSGFTFDKKIEDKILEEYLSDYGKKIEDLNLDIKNKTFLIHNSYLRKGEIIPVNRERNFDPYPSLKNYSFSSGSIMNEGFTKEVIIQFIQTINEKIDILNCKVWVFPNDGGPSNNYSENEFNKGVFAEGETQDEIADNIVKIVSDFTSKGYLPASGFNYYKKLNPENYDSKISIDCDYFNEVKTFENKNDNALIEFKNSMSDEKVYFISKIAFLNIDDTFGIIEDAIKTDKNTIDSNIVDLDSKFYIYVFDKIPEPQATEDKVFSYFKICAIDSEYKEDNRLCVGNFKLTPIELLIKSNNDIFNKEVENNFNISNIDYIKYAEKDGASKFVLTLNKNDSSKEYYVSQSKDGFVTEYSVPYYQEVLLLKLWLKDFDHIIPPYSKTTKWKENRTKFYNDQDCEVYPFIKGMPTVSQYKEHLKKIQSDEYGIEVLDSSDIYKFPGGWIVYGDRLTYEKSKSDNPLKEKFILLSNEYNDDREFDFGSENSTHLQIGTTREDGEILFKMHENQFPYEKSCNLVICNKEFTKAAVVARGNQRIALISADRGSSDGWSKETLDESNLYLSYGDNASLFTRKTNKDYIFDLYSSIDTRNNDLYILYIERKILNYTTPPQTEGEMKYIKKIELMNWEGRTYDLDENYLNSEKYKIWSTDYNDGEEENFDNGMWIDGEQLKSIYEASQDKNYNFYLYDASLINDGKEFTNEEIKNSDYKLAIVNVNEDGEMVEKADFVLKDFYSIETDNVSFIQIDKSPVDGKLLLISYEDRRNPLFDDENSSYPTVKSYNEPLKKNLKEKDQIPNYRLFVLNINEDYSVDGRMTEIKLSEKNYFSAGLNGTIEPEVSKPFAQFDNEGNIIALTSKDDDREGSMILKTFVFNTASGEETPNGNLNFKDLGNEIISLPSSPSESEDVIYEFSGKIFDLPKYNSDLRNKLTVKYEEKTGTDKSTIEFIYIDESGTEYKLMSGNGWGFEQYAWKCSQFDKNDCTFYDISELNIELNVEFKMYGSTDSGGIELIHYPANYLSPEQLETEKKGTSNNNISIVVKSIANSKSGTTDSNGYLSDKDAMFTKTDDSEFIVDKDIYLSKEVYNLNNSEDIRYENIYEYKERVFELKKYDESLRNDVGVLYTTEGNVQDTQPSHIEFYYFDENGNKTKIAEADSPETYHFSVFTKSSLKIYEIPDLKLNFDINCRPDDIEDYDVFYYPHTDCTPETIEADLQLGEEIRKNRPITIEVKKLVRKNVFTKKIDWRVIKLDYETNKKIYYKGKQFFNLPEEETENYPVVKINKKTPPQGMKNYYLLFKGIGTSDKPLSKKYDEILKGQTDYEINGDELNTNFTRPTLNHVYIVTHMNNDEKVCHKIELSSPWENYVICKDLNSNDEFYVLFSEEKRIRRVAIEWNEFVPSLRIVEEIILPEIPIKTEIDSLIDSNQELLDLKIDSYCMISNDKHTIMRCRYGLGVEFDKLTESQLEALGKNKKVIFYDKIFMFDRSTSTTVLKQIDSKLIAHSYTEIGYQPVEGEPYTVLNHIFFDHYNNESDTVDYENIEVKKVEDVFPSITMKEFTDDNVSNLQADDSIIYDCYDDYRYSTNQFNDKTIQLRDDKLLIIDSFKTNVVKKDENELRNKQLILKKVSVYDLETKEFDSSYSDYNRDEVFNITRGVENVITKCVYPEVASIVFLKDKSIAVYSLYQSALISPKIVVGDNNIVGKMTMYSWPLELNTSKLDINYLIATESNKVWRKSVHIAEDAVEDISQSLETQSLNIILDDYSDIIHFNNTKKISNIPFDYNKKNFYDVRDYHISKISSIDYRIVDEIRIEREKLPWASDSRLLTGFTENFVFEINVNKNTGKVGVLTALKILFIDFNKSDDKIEEINNHEKILDFINLFRFISLLNSEPPYDKDSLYVIPFYNIDFNNDCNAFVVYKKFSHVNNSVLSAYAESLSVLLVGLGAYKNLGEEQKKQLDKLCKLLTDDYCDNSVKICYKNSENVWEWKYKKIDPNLKTSAEECVEEWITSGNANYSILAKYYEYIFFISFHNNDIYCQKSYPNPGDSDTIEFINLNNYFKLNLFNDENFIKFNFNNIDKTNLFLGNRFIINDKLSTAVSLLEGFTIKSLLFRNNLTKSEFIYGELNKSNEDNAYIYHPDDSLFIERKYKGLTGLRNFVEGFSITTSDGEIIFVDPIAHRVFDFRKIDFMDIWEDKRFDYNDPIFNQEDHDLTNVIPLHIVEGVLVSNYYFSRLYRGLIDLPFDEKQELPRFEDYYIKEVYYGENDEDNHFLFMHKKYNFGYKVTKCRTNDFGNTKNKDLNIMNRVGTSSTISAPLYKILEATGMPYDIPCKTFGYVIIEGKQYFIEAIKLTQPYHVTTMPRVNETGGIELLLDRNTKFSHYTLDPSIDTASDDGVTNMPAISLGYIHTESKEVGQIRNAWFTQTVKTANIYRKPINFNAFNLYHADKNVFRNISKLGLIINDKFYSAENLYGACLEIDVNNNKIINEYGNRYIAGNYRKQIIYIEKYNILFTAVIDLSEITEYQPANLYNPDSSIEKSYGRFKFLIKNLNVNDPNWYPIEINGIDGRSLKDVMDFHYFEDCILIPCVMEDDSQKTIKLFLNESEGNMGFEHTEKLITYDITASQNNRTNIAPSSLSERFLLSVNASGKSNIIGNRINVSVYEEVVESSFESNGIFDSEKNRIIYVLPTDTKFKDIMSSNVLNENYDKCFIVTNKTEAITNILTSMNSGEAIIEAVLPKAVIIEDVIFEPKENIVILYYKESEEYKILISIDGGITYSELKKEYAIYNNDESIINTGKLNKDGKTLYLFNTKKAVFVKSLWLNESNYNRLFGENDGDGVCFFNNENNNICYFSDIDDYLFEELTLPEGKWNKLNILDKHKIYMFEKNGENGIDNLILDNINHVVSYVSTPTDGEKEDIKYLNDKNLNIMKIGKPDSIGNCLITYEKEIDLSKGIFDCEILDKNAISNDVYSLKMPNTIEPSDGEFVVGMQGTTVDTGVQLKFVKINIHDMMSNKSIEETEVIPLEDSEDLILEKTPHYLNNVYYDKLTNSWIFASTSTNSDGVKISNILVQINEKLEIVKKIKISNIDSIPVNLTGQMMRIPDFGDYILCFTSNTISYSEAVKNQDDLATKYSKIWPFVLLNLESGTFKSANVFEVNYFKDIFNHNKMLPNYNDRFLPLVLEAWYYKNRLYLLCTTRGGEEKGYRALELLEVSFELKKMKLLRDSKMKDLEQIGSAAKLLQGYDLTIVFSKDLARNEPETLDI